VKFHSVAEIFPLIEGPEFESLVNDVRIHGVREPVWTHNEQIIDGRNRWRAAQSAGVECPSREYAGDPANLVQFVVSLNLHRRHLNESQRAMVAAKIANLDVGKPNRANLHDNVTKAEAAEMLSVSERSVASARKVRDSGSPELTAAVERGEVSVSAASDVATLPRDQQAEIVARGEKEILAAAKEIRAGRAVAIREQRIEKLAAISKGNRDLITDQKYPIILADPPWRYENPPMGGGNRSIENHYPTMTLDEICALPVQKLATDDALIYLWATAPKLAECIEVLKAWEFEYRTCFVWVKDKIGMGYHARNQHELLLVGKRGNIPPPPIEARVSSVIHGERAEHSAKPAEVYRLIESFYPSLPKIELFCRTPQPGWDVWGNQANAA